MGRCSLCAPRVERLVPGGFDALLMPNLNFIATRQPYLIFVHDLSFARHPEWFTPKMRLWHRMVRPKDLLARAAAVLAVSEFTKNDVVSLYGIDPVRITVVPPAVPATATAGVPAPEHGPDNATPAGRPYFLSLSALEPRKNITGLIRAFDALDRDDVDLVIAGPKGWMYDEIFRTAARARSRGRIRFAGPISEAEKTRLLRGATALVYPSFYEGFGIPALEAMAAGCPVIASLATAVSETVGNAAFLVEPTRPADITGAMAALLDDTTLRERLVAAGTERAKRYSWEVSAEAVERAIVASCG